MNSSWNLLYGYDQHIFEETEWNRKEQKTLATVKAHTDTHTDMYPGRDIKCISFCGTCLK